jgi:restriction endonuclease Mrr
MYKHFDKQFDPIRYISLGNSFLSQKSNVLLINYMYSLLHQQMDTQAVSSITELKSTDYLCLVDDEEDKTRKKIVFSIRLSKCGFSPERLKETYSKLSTPIVSVNGGEPSPFYTCLAREYRPIIQLEVSSEVVSCWESWFIPYISNDGSKYDIPLFLSLYSRINQKEIIIDIETLKRELEAFTYSYYCDFDKRCLKSAQKHINKAFDDGKSVLKFDYKPVKQHGFNNSTTHLSFSIVKKDIDDAGKSDVSEENVPKAVQRKEYPKSENSTISNFQSSIENIRNYILEVIKHQSWKSFESFVCSLMLKMEYGDFHPLKASVTSSTRDNGIDGYLELDEFGQKKIYFQAKRWDSTKVGRPELQKFVGALHSYNNAIAGFFVTTSTFTNDALAYADSLSCSFDLVLIDKYKLCKLIGKNLL